MSGDFGVRRFTTTLGRLWFRVREWLTQFERPFAITQAKCTAQDTYAYPVSDRTDFPSHPYEDELP
jgi:hypothetical protein